MEWWHVYLFTRLDGLQALLQVILGVVLVCGVIAGISWGVNADMDRFGDKYATIAARAKKALFTLAGVALAVGLLSVAVPTQKEAAAIYLLPKLAHSDFAKEAQQLPTDAAKLLRLKLEAWVADMESTKTVKK